MVDDQVHLGSPHSAFHAGVIAGIAAAKHQDASLQSEWLELVEEWVAEGREGPPPSIDLAERYRHALQEYRRLRKEYPRLGPSRPPTLAEVAATEEKRRKFLDDIDLAAGGGVDA